MSMSTPAVPSRRRARQPLQRDHGGVFSRLKTFVSPLFGWSNGAEGGCGEHSGFEPDVEPDPAGKRRRGLSEQENRQPKRQRVSSPLKEHVSVYNVSQFPPADFPQQPSRLSQGVGGLSLAERTASPAPTEVRLPPVSVSYLQRARDSQQRESVQPAEAPSVQALQEKPSFVRPLSQARDVFPARSLSRQPQPATTTTLELLAQTHRRTQSPVRQHSALVFQQPPRESPDPVTRSAPNAAARALAALDSYKQLMPTRTQQSIEAQKEYLSASKTVGVVRKKPLTFLSDEERRYQNIGVQKPKKADGPPASPFSPYGGESNTQRRLRKSFGKDDERNLEEDEQASEPQSKPAEPPVPALPTNETKGKAWSKPTTTQASSSLRVGRDKPGRHQPSARRGKFSAANLDDADEPDPRDFSDLETAAKKVPVFKAPSSLPGFTFANHSKQIQFDPLGSSKAPLPSLPFSFTDSPQPKQDAASSSDALAPSPVASFAFESPKKPASPLKESASFASRILDFEAIPKQPESQKETTPVSTLTPAPTAEAKPVDSKPAETPSAQPGPTLDENSPFWDAKSPEKSKPLAKPVLFSFTEPKKDETKASAPAPTGLFAGLAAPSQSSSLFGSAPAGSSLFGGSAKPSESAKPANPPAFSFGKPAETSSSLFGSKPAETEPSKPAPAPSLFGSKPAEGSSLFGSKPAEGSSLFGSKPAESSLFGSKPPESSLLFSGKPAESTTPATLPAPPTSAPVVFNFGTPPPAPAPVSTTPSSSPVKFGGSSPAAGFSFGNTASSTTPTIEAPKASTPFSFGATTPQPEIPKLNTGFSFSQPSTTPVSEPSKPLFGTPTPEPKPLFSFGQSAQEPPKPAAAPQFSFGPATPTEVKPSFSFGPTQTGTTTPVGPPPSNPFSFGSTTADANKAPAFGARPQTPPRESNDMSMDDSPERNAGPRSTEPRPTSFSFGSAAPTITVSNPFGQSSAPASTSFPFGSSAPAPVAPSTSFGQPTKSDDGRSSPFAFSQPPPQTATGAAPSFSFNSQPDSSSLAPRPATTGSFSFSPSTSTGSNSGGSSAPFAFGSSTSQNGSAPSNPFGQASSTPGSPAGFGTQQNGFSFGGGAAAPGPIQTSTSNAPFQFSGSQPASPAVSTHSLPGGGGAFSFGAPQIQSSTSGGGSSFTMGAAPSGAAPQNGRRPVKGMPRQRRITGK